MRTPHKHAEVIKAWADGAEIEYKDTLTGPWRYAGTPTWDKDIDYRVKPEKKPNIVIHCKAVVDGLIIWRAEKEHMGNLRLIFDGETEELLDAVVL